MQHIVSSAFFALSSTHIIPYVLPLQHQALYAYWKPGIQWLLCGTMVAAGAPTLFCVAAIPHAAMAALALLSVGKTNILCQQLLYVPAAMSILSWCLRKVFGGHVSFTIALSCLLVQLVHIVIGGVVTMLYPATIVPSIMDMSAVRKSMERDPQGIQFARIPVLNAQGHISLDAIVIHPAQVPSKFARTKYVIYCGGNGELFEGTYVSLVALADRLGVTVVTANPMGVGQSGGVVRNAADLVLSARSTAEWILAGNAAKGGTVAVSRRDVVVFGHSIGGGVASQLVAEWYPEFGLVLDRSFSSLADAAISLSPVSKWPRLVRAILAFANFGDMDNMANFQRITHKRKLVTFHRDDQIIKFGESSIARLPPFRQQRFPGGAASGSNDASCNDASNDLSSFVLEVYSHKFTSDPHNIGIVDLDGFDAVSKRVLSFYERSLSE